ncbi:protein mono-ADP-ribosyltransferase PARP14-like [Polyodon spathula]|uniref:protein mono-ADP-ribosyltransferase PARP14-like n=1 Tax=Polyodon spathula TaxID=7913 RepID=UPI001B7E1F55|nr:protein mono-ADP-ribosyltransferase PARP14-like [Polyodon spathula]
MEASNYRYLLYFDMPGLDVNQQDKVGNYFKVKRKSDGGECSLKKISDSVYHIAFKDEEAQKRVLERREHSIEMPSGCIVITVRDSEYASSGLKSAHTSPASQQVNVDKRNQFDLDQESRRRQSPLGLGKAETESLTRPLIVLKLDSYLIRYLQDCAEAGNELHHQLSLLRCLVHLCQEKDEATVTLEGGNESSCLKENIKKAFEDIQERYKCHYEANLTKQQTLMKSPELVNKSLRIYPELSQGFTVIVGLNEDIRKILQILDALVFQKIRTESSIKTECMIRGPKYKLVRNSFENELRVQFPSLVISGDCQFSLFLEGAPEEVHYGRLKLLELLNQVQERFVKLTSLQISFLKRSGTQQFMTKFFSTLQSPVTLEADLDVKLFGLSKKGLEEAEKVLLVELQEDVIRVPEDCLLSTHLPQLKEFLQSTESHLNYSGARNVEILYSQKSNTVSQKIHVVGYNNEVKRAREMIKSYIEKINTTITQEVLLQSSQLADYFFDLLELIDFQNCAVEMITVHSPSPAVQLTGPYQRVMDIKNYLQQALDTLVLERLIISKPGAYEYFQGPGKEYLTLLGKKYCCLLKMTDTGNVAVMYPAEGASEGVLCSFQLGSNLSLLIQQGDITKLKVDSIVNAANEDLMHGGGLALAISTAGGAAIQQESKELVKMTGKVLPGNAVVTSAGKLFCKKVIHAVGPKWENGKSPDRVKQLLESAIKQSLELANKMGFESVAVPCLSSGIFGVPQVICAECIVSAVRSFARVPSSLRVVTLIDIRKETVKEFQTACQKLFGNDKCTEEFERIQEKELGATAFPVSEEATAGVDTLKVEIVQGKIEEQKTDVLVAPLKDLDLASTRVAKALLERAGSKLGQSFVQSASGVQFHPGNVMAVSGDSGLDCKQVLFLLCSQWDGPQGNAIKALHRGLQACLEHCNSMALESISFPVIGSGVVLGFPHEVAAEALLSEVSRFEQDHISSWIKTVRIVIHPRDTQSTAAFRDAQKGIDLKELRMETESEQIFYHSVSSHPDDITIMMDGVKLQVVHGDIVTETVDVIVNSTDFTTDYKGVALAILSAAGPGVQRSLQTATVPPEEIVVTQPGNLKCKLIMHVCGEKDAGFIKKQTKRVILLCEQQSYKSVAFPAICTGVGGLDPWLVAKAMVDGVASAVRDRKLHFVSTVRIVLWKRDVFTVFKCTVEGCFGRAAPLRTPIEFTKHLMQKVKTLQLLKQTPDTDKRELFRRSQDIFLPAIFDVIGLKRSDTEKAKQKLESIFNLQFHEESLLAENISNLKKEEVQAVLNKAKLLRVQATIEHDGSNKLLIRGVKSEVMEVSRMVQHYLRSALERQLKEGKQILAEAFVQWYYEEDDRWKAFDPEANLHLETNRTSKETVLRDRTGKILWIDLQQMMATDQDCKQSVRVKRMEKMTDYILPVYWDNMNDQLFKKFQLQPHTKEYLDVVKYFNKTATNTVHKVERIQNQYLRQSYDLKKKQLEAKNGQNQVRERILYHGTKLASCESIEKTGFNRSYAGKNATAYGHGVYFAVNASYSAQPTYSLPDSKGLRYMYVARVLTGRYTVGNSTMKVPPKRSTDAHDRYDSLVNNAQNPTIFVIFHDDQAYPDYLITFQ